MGNLMFRFYFTNVYFETNLSPNEKHSIIHIGLRGVDVM